MRKRYPLKWSIAALIITVTTTAYVVADDYFEISKNLEIFTSVYRELNMYYVDDTKPGELMKTGIDAMLRSLDPYTVYYPESKIEDYRFMTTGQYGGIGALVNTIDGEVTIMEPYEDNPAHKAGIKAGDVILSVDGKEVKGLKTDEVSGLLKGQAGTVANIKVRRAVSNEELTLEVERSDVQIPDVPYYGMLDDQTGYIHLRSFTQTASQEVRKSLLELRDQEGMKQLVLDLRGNGGGLLREAVSIVNLFVPKGTEIVSTKGKLEEWNKNYVALNEPLAPTLPLIVLTDQQSASASEIVSGALQDLDRAVVVGNNTFGKGLVQQTKDLNYNAKVKLTVAKYYIPSGRCIQKLDYASRSENGRPGELPDSLVKAFQTSNGRVVFDGRGVRPDIEVELEEMSNVLAGLLSNHLIFKFANQYAAEKTEIGDPESFTIGDEYEAFIDYCLQQEFDYDTATEQVFKELKTVAEAERLFDRSDDLFRQLEERLMPEKERDLAIFQDQVRYSLDEEIVSRFHYQQGAIRYGLAHDPVVKRALEVFGEEYRKVLTGANE